MAMVNSFSFFQYSLLFLFFIQLPVFSSGGGFTVDLIHSDSPLSPLYDPSKTPSDRRKEAIHISHSRAAYFSKVFSKSAKKIQAEAIPIRLGFLVAASIGTPPQPFYGVIETASDVTWTQCLPCDGCYRQTNPKFDPKKSSTYNPLNCSSPICQGEYFRCDSTSAPSDICPYQVDYGDGSYSFGDVAVETFTFGSTSVPNLVFGCGHTEAGTFPNTSTGLIGLGGGNNSIVSQMKESINGKFSHCFAPYGQESDVMGKLSFGDDAVLSGPGVVSTPIKPSNNSYYDTYYLLTLESVKVGKKSISYPYDTKGNIVIDSGTTFTYLPRTLIPYIVNFLTPVIKADPIPDPEGNFDLCYNSSTTKFDGPPITFGFTGPDVEVPQSTAFIDFDDIGVACLAFVPTDSETATIFGNLLQVNFQVGYDLKAKTVSFKPADCSRQ